MLNPYIFREYDIRGIVKEDFTDENVSLLGKGIGTFLVRNGSRSVSVGRDVRESSERIRDGVIDGLLSTGLEVVDVGLVPTPAVYFSMLEYGLDGGVMITGSHNSLEFNGIKIAKKGVGPVFGRQIRQILEIIEKKDFITSVNAKQSERDVMDDYIQALRSKFTFARPLKIVVDTGNGMASLLMPELWKSLGHDVTCLYCEPDGSFPNHLPDPQHERYMTDLAGKVKEVGADLGIGYDGDCDRAGFIDETGRLVTTDRIAAILAPDVLKNYPGAEILFDVRCSMFLKDEIEKLGGKLSMWKCGNTPIKARMTEVSSPFAAEFSGHIFLNDGSFTGSDDAFYISGRFMETLSRSRKSFSELVDELPKHFSTSEIHLDAPDDKKFDIISEMVSYFKKKHKVIDIDGARVEFGDGWGLVRASNTNPRITLRFEAKNRRRLEEIMNIFKDVIKKYPSIVFDERAFLESMPE